MMGTIVMFDAFKNHRSPSSTILGGVTSLVIALWTLSACKVIDPPSGALACTTTAECEAPRVCELGYCVVPPAFLPDADPAAPDADPNMPDATPPPDADPNAPDADLTCNAITLVDDFADGDASPLWTVESSAGITVVEAAGVLTMGIPSLFMPPQTAAYISTASYDMRGHSFFIEIPTMMSTASLGEATLSIRASAIDNLEVRQKLGDMSVSLSVGGVISTPVAGLPYSATEHRWWRVVEAGGTTRVQTSATGTSWTELASVATPDFFASVNVALEVQGFGAGSIPGDTVFDNANGGGAVPACP
jgi:hypothetical protein